MNRSERASLRALLKQHGIQQTYRAAGGATVKAPVESLLATLVALGVDTTGSLDDIARREQRRATARIIEPVLVAWHGRVADVLAQLPERALHCELQLENGDVETLAAGSRRSPLPLGYHRLRVSTADGEAQALVIAAPRRCFESENVREWGVFAPLYGIRRRHDQPIGDIADLTALMRWVGELGGDVVGTLPISASFLRTPFEPSPMPQPAAWPGTRST